VASPDTDELSTVPIPAGAPDAESAAGAETRAVPQQQTEPLGVAEAQDAAGQRTERLAARPDAAEAQSAVEQRTERLAARPGAAEAQDAAEQRTESLAAGSSAAEAQTVPQERVEPERIEPADPTSADGSPDPAAEPTEPAKPRGRWWRGFTGSLAAGLTVLAIGVLAVAVIDLNTGAPGPGAVLLIGHPVAAVLALLAQRVADRRNGVPAAGAGVAVVLFTVSALTLFWLT
jgi:hypothetical protein